METQIQQRTPPLRGTLYRVLEARFGGDPRAINLCSEFLSREMYDRRFAAKLISVCDGSAGYSWNIRLFATLMLANQCCQVGPGCDEEFTFLFRRFGILSAEANRIDDRVFREGYTSTDFRMFVTQFLRNLSRLERIHRNIRGLQTTARALDEFIRFSRDPCKLTLARYLFAPAEVVERVQEELTLSSGVESPLEAEGIREAGHYLSRFPEIFYLWRLMVRGVRTAFLHC